ncbi:SOS response-associated peptidase [candidate division KSB1 bacterium]
MRFARESKLIAIEKAFKLNAPFTEDMRPNYNTAPTQKIPAVVNDGGGRKLTEFKWGLIPSWAKEPSIANKLLNARGETLTEKPSFREAFRKRRCIIPADGYYEWVREGESRLPVYVQHTEEEIFGLAGLWEVWSPKEDLFTESEEVFTCTIITIGSNELLEPLHPRMPVILPPEKYDEWLDPKNQDSAKLRELLKPYPANKMKYHRVSQYVNSPKHNDPGCTRPIQE